MVTLIMEFEDDPDVEGGVQVTGTLYHDEDSTENEQEHANEASEIIREALFSDDEDGGEGLQEPSPRIITLN